MEFTNSKILKDMPKKELLSYMMPDLINRRTICCVGLNFSSLPLVHACLELTISGSVWRLFKMKPNFHSSIAGPDHS